MADVTGPISTLSGSSHDVPDGMMCDEHPDRPAIARIQGETDSFGCEMHDLCQECLDAERAYRNSPEAAEWRKDTCEWWFSHGSPVMIETNDLRTMPSNLNDACRKMELAADCIDLLRLRVASAEREAASLKEFIERYGRQRAVPDEAARFPMQPEEKVDDEDGSEAGCGQRVIEPWRE